MNYNIHGLKHKGNKSKGIFIIFCIVVVLIAGSIFFIVTRVDIGNFYQKSEIEKVSKRLFEQKDYLELIKKMDKELKNEPFSVDYLTYRGYSYFFLGEEEKNIEKRKNYFSIALIDLRKAMSIGLLEKNKPNVFFCLGKIYYYFGEPYYNLSVEYLNKSLLLGNKRKDLYYVLGLVYSNIGNYKDSISSYLEALKIEETDLLLLAIGMAYYKNSEAGKAKDYFHKVIKITKDEKVKEKGLLQYGIILFEEKQYSEAFKYFSKVIEMNENNASAYFYMGEVYFFDNNKVKARSEWRKTLEIDPSHIQALKRIY